MDSTLMSEPVISVIMPVYNAETYVEEAIKSILNQTFEDFEFLIINDGSEDNSLSIINNYASKDNRIKIISREKKGLVFSLNEGIKLAKGKYIARMDADDISVPERFKKQISYLERNSDVDICGTWIETFGRSMEVLKYPVQHDDIKVALLFAFGLAHPSIMAKKTLKFIRMVKITNRFN